MLNNLASDWKQWPFLLYHSSMCKCKLSEPVSQSDNRQAGTPLAGSHESSTHLNILPSVLFLLLTCKRCVMRFGFCLRSDFATFHKKVIKKERTRISSFAGADNIRVHAVREIHTIQARNRQHNIVLHEVLLTARQSKLETQGLNQSVRQQACKHKLKM